MPVYNRGGKSLFTGEIGKLRCLKQHILLPGERLSPMVRGNVRVAGLKQQTSVYLHASIEAFASPIRWFETDFPEYIKDGVSGVRTLSSLSGNPWTTDYGKTQTLGLGRITTDFFKFYAQNLIAVWNEWYRWPEDAKESLSSPSITFFQDNGKECVNLPSAMTRIHDAPVFDTSEVNVPSTTTVDVRTLAQYQARFATRAKQDWTILAAFVVCCLRFVFIFKDNDLL